MHPHLSSFPLGSGDAWDRRHHLPPRNPQEEDLPHPSDQPRGGGAGEGAPCPACTQPWWLQAAGSLLTAQHGQAPGDKFFWVEASEPLSCHQICHHSEKPERGRADGPCSSGSPGQRGALPGGEAAMWTPAGGPSVYFLVCDHRGRTGWWGGRDGELGPGWWGNPGRSVGRSHSAVWQCPQKQLPWSHVIAPPLPGSPPAPTGGSFLTRVRTWARHRGVLLGVWSEPKGRGIKSPRD